MCELNYKFFLCLLMVKGQFLWPCQILHLVRNKEFTCWLYENCFHHWKKSNNVVRWDLLFFLLIESDEKFDNALSRYFRWSNISQPEPHADNMQGSHWETLVYVKSMIQFRHMFWLCGCSFLLLAGLQCCCMMMVDCKICCVQICRLRPLKTNFEGHMT